MKELESGEIEGVISCIEEVGFKKIGALDKLKGYIQRNKGDMVFTPSRTENL